MLYKTVEAGEIVLYSTRLSAMKTIALFLLCTVFALSTAKPSHDDYLGFLIKAIEKQMRLQTSSVASVQEKPGEEICQSATYRHKTDKTYVHVCESEREGKPCMQASWFCHSVAYRSSVHVTRYVTA